MVDRESEFESSDDKALSDSTGFDNDEAVDESGEGDDGDEEISLDALSAAYAGLVGDQNAEPSAEANDEREADPADSDEEDDAADSPADEDEQASPEGILEAVLFVGNSENKPLTSKQIAALMRGVSPREIDELVVELNQRYEEEGCPYEVVSQGAGYSLCIRPEYANLRDRFYGSVREARLSQASIDILAVIAYGQPLTREEIDETRGKPCGGILSQLVRRQLLRIERPESKPRRPRYYTTERFLKIMGLDDISELPESHEFDKSF